MAHCDAVWRGVHICPGLFRFEEKVFQGPLGRITRDAIDFIQRNCLKETVIKHPHRPEAERFWNFPYAVMKKP